jgi:cold-inducible RNA-binding protein
MGNKLYIGNLPYSVTDQSLMEAFNQYGEVESAKIIIDRETGRSKGFGFVEMRDAEEAALAIDKLNGKNLDGRPMTVNEAKPPVPRSNGGYSDRGGRRY